MSRDSIDIKLKEVVDDIRQGLKMDGGDVELVSFEDGVVTLRFQGACVGCPMAAVTFKEFIEKEIKNSLPEAKEVRLINVV